MKKIFIIFIISIIALIHFFIINVLEKNIYQLFIATDKRPDKRCINNDTFNCLGMPSGHTETITIICLLLYYSKYISIYTALLIILIIGFQRILFKRHTLSQVIVGFILGIIYSLIYIKTNISFTSIIIIFLIILLYISLLTSKITLLLNEQIPSWVDISLIPKINKKKNVSYSHKLYETCQILIPYKNKIYYINWKLLEKKLDLLILKIKDSNIKYDAIVGIKTGGAILCKYIAQKLNIKYYFIKTTNKKKSLNFLYDSIYRIINIWILNNYNPEFEVCEYVNDDLKDKNIILIDEIIESGATFTFVYNYLINNKKVSNILPLTIFNGNKNIKIHVPIIDINETYIIWPWGFDN